MKPKLKSNEMNALVKSVSAKLLTDKAGRRVAQIDKEIKEYPLLFKGCKNFTSNDLYKPMTI